MQPGPLITFFMHDFAGGGVERMRIRIAAGLADQGFRVHLVVVRHQGSLVSAIPPGLQVIELGAGRTLAAIPGLVRYFRAHRPQVCFSSLGHNNIIMLISALLARTGTHTVLGQHNALAQETRIGPKYRLLPLLYRALAPFASAFLAVSAGVARELHDLCGIPTDKILRIYNPVVGADFATRLAAPAPAELQASPHPPCFLFAGRLEAQKGPDIALRAFRLFRATSPGRLIFLGEGPMRAELEAEARACGLDGDITFAGYQQDVLPWMAAAHALIMPSRYEGFGNAIVEALACGTQVAAAIQGSTSCW